MVEEVKLFLAAWTPKNIQTKLIHFLGGVSKDEAEAIYRESFYQGGLNSSIRIKRYLIEIEKQIYGKPKQEWINIIHAAIKNL